ncbi:MAG: hypothetical protein ACR2NA_12985 [Solirubrobacterales bacterium]
MEPEPGTQQTEPDVRDPAIGEVLLHLAILGGAIFMVAGALGPWGGAVGISFRGVEFGQGKVLIGTGVAALLLHMLGRGAVWSSALVTGSALVGSTALIELLRELQNTPGADIARSLGLVELGWGFPVALVGCILVLAGAIASIVRQVRGWRVEEDERAAPDPPGP